MHAHRLLVEDAGHIARRAGRGVGVVGVRQLDGIVGRLLFSGVLIRYPELKLSYAESQIGWLPYVLERVDDVWEDNQAWAQTKHIPEPPSTYYYSNVSVCFFKDQSGIEALDRVGWRNIAFETDYPHGDTTWPDTLPFVERSLGHILAEDVYDILRGNAIRMLSLGID